MKPINHSYKGNKKWATIKWGTWHSGTVSGLNHSFFLCPIQIYYINQIPHLNLNITRHMHQVTLSDDPKAFSQSLLLYKEDHTDAFTTCVWVTMHCEDVSLYILCILGRTWSPPCSINKTAGRHSLLDYYVQNDKKKLKIFFFSRIWLVFEMTRCVTSNYKVEAVPLGE